MDMLVVREYLAELVLAALDERKPTPIPEGLSVAQLVQMAHETQMVFLLLSPLLQLPLQESERESVRGYLLNSMLRTQFQLHAVKEIEQLLEGAGIRHQILKGAVLQHLYPKPEYREMSDIDVMIYDHRKEEAGRLLAAQGYVLQESVSQHDAYRKPPFLSVEMHWSLYDQEVDAHQATYYADFSRHRLKDGYAYACEFSNEDYYVYMISHMAKHFYARGCGIRNLVDIFVFCTLYPKQTASAYVAREMGACGLTSFERNIKKLSFAWLGGGEKPDNMDVFFNYMYRSGVHGRDENGIWRRVALYKKPDVGKNNFYLRLWYMFPPFLYLREDYPWLEGRRWLLPWAWVVRASARAGGKKKDLRLRLLKEVSKEEFTAMQRLYSELDLDFRKKAEKG